MSFYTVYNPNYGCYFIGLSAITQRSRINSGKRPFLVQELQFLIAQASLIANVNISYVVDDAENALHEILIHYYENPVLHKIWIHFYGYQRDYLTLYTPENHQISDDIYDCFNDALLHQPGKYIESYKIPSLLEEEDEVHTEPEVISEPEVSSFEIDISSSSSLPPSPSEIVSEVQPEVKQEAKKEVFNWMLFKSSLDSITKPHPNEEISFQLQPLAPKTSRRYRGKRRNGHICK